MQQQPGHQVPQQPVRAHAQPPAGSSARPGDSEIIFEGVARATSVYSGYIKWFGASVVGGVAAYLLGLITFFSTWPLWVLGFVGIPGMLWTFFRYRTTRYKITNRRLEHEHGVLTTTVDSIELWRVLDVRYSQNIIDRMFGNATVTLIGTDQTDPEFELYGLPNARKLFEDLREAVQAARHTSRPMEMVGADGMMENMLEHQ
ncbi:MAG: PH domain-containing protein [Nannocystales bacterium]